MMKNITVFVDAFLPSSETFIYNRIAGFKLFKPHVLCKKVIENSDFQYHPIHCAQKEKSIFQTSAAYYNRVIRDNKISLIQAHYSINGFTMLPIAKKNCIPLITFFHGTDIYYFKDPIFKLRFRNLLKNGDYFVVPSEETRQNVIQMGEMATGSRLIMPALIQSSLFPEIITT